MGPVTEQSEHLSSAQIENYGHRTSGVGPDAAQGDERQGVNHQSSDDQSISDQRVEAHLADCASCRNRLLDFHRSLFVSPTYQPEPDQPKADASKSDLKNDSPEHETSLPGHPSSGDSPSGYWASGHLPPGQRPADSRLEGAGPTDSALADSKFANSKYPADPQVRTAATPECPSDDALRQLAAGLSVDDTATTGDAFATKLLQHAASCDHCGPLLRIFTEDFSDDFSAEEQAALANLQSSSADWQKNTARQMMKAAATRAAAAVEASAAGRQSSRQKSFKGSPKTTAGRKPFFWKWVMVPAIAAVVAVAAFSIWYAQRDTPEKVEKLLAQAYTENRTTELRWPGAKYANIRQTRSGESGSILSVPESLRNAANEIDSGLRKNPDDSKWLLLSARLHLMEGHYQPALTDLNKIDNERTAGTSDYLITRALALYEKGESEPNGRQFYGEAVDLLGKVLQQNPDNPAALFNQALACEKIFAFDCAASDWDRMLKVEKDSNWAHEAQQHLIQIQEKKKLEH